MYNLQFHCGFWKDRRICRRCSNFMVWDVKVFLILVDGTMSWTCRIFSKKHLNSNCIYFLWHATNCNMCDTPDWRRHGRMYCFQWQCQEEQCWAKCHKQVKWKGFSAINRLVNKSELTGTAVVNKKSSQKVAQLSFQLQYWREEKW
jgi:hypothetical protein